MRCFIIFGCLILSCDAWNEAGRSFHFYDIFHISKQLNSQHPSIYDSTSRRLDTGNQRTGAVFSLQTKLMTGRHATWEDRKKAGIVLLTPEFYVGPVIFFTVFLFSSECSSAQVECFSRILNHQCSMFSHMLSPHKRFPCLHHKFTICL